MTRDDQAVDSVSPPATEQATLYAAKEPSPDVVEDSSRAGEEQIAPDSHETIEQQITARAATFGGRPFRAKRPPDCARCAGCGADAISAYPTFSAGAGVAARPYSDDVICRKCGHIGPPGIVMQ